MSRVYLVGIGPGSPGLLTIKAAEAIRSADIVRHPPEVEPAILGMARPGAVMGPYREADEIIQLAKHDHRVAVLFHGDPFALGFGASLALRLRQEDIQFEVVPGVLAEAAGPAISGISPDRLGRPGYAGTVAFRLTTGEVERAVADMLVAGADASADAVLILNPGRAGQRKLVGPLGELAQLAKPLRHEELVLVVGRGVEAAESLDSLVGRPLHGRRVLVTRARQQAEEFHRHLADLGAWVVDVPTIEVRPLRIDGHIRDSVDRLDQTQLVVFASVNAVDIFFDMLFELGRDARALRNSRLCAIGPETARALEGHGLVPELVSGEYTAEGLAETLGNWDLTGARILVPRARQNRDGLPAILAKRGAEVVILPVYELACPTGASTELHRLLDADPVDVVTFTSTATVVNFAGSFGSEDLKSLLARTSVACMGPVTADTARRLGMRVDIIAGEYTARGLAQAVAAFFKS
ncbi:MAG TPA: uroporphyrinogen-III synthase [Candidatus Dormibacteraeota bacterium]|nr:uroporphyrinogen-III synthase [Candidatus Dormibacteraeota bacterium]